MKKLMLISSLFVILSMLLSACALFGGRAFATPTPTSSEPASPSVAATDTPTSVPDAGLQPINLAGPDVGTTMVWVDGSTLIFIPGGEFTMGAGGDDNPETRISLSDFWIYRTKVTNRMYALCVAAGLCAPPDDPTAAAALVDISMRDKPVVGVNWNQGEVYCQWAKGELPTEAQWEKTARGPDGNIYPWGDAAPTCDLLNFNNCLGEISRVFDYPAGKSYYDALDMSGNAFEWVMDWYDPHYYRPAEDPMGPEQGTVRSVRGSSYASTADQVAPFRRYYLEPDKNRLDLGFRCVVVDPQLYAPYCETSAHSSDTPATPSTGCEFSVTEAGHGCGTVTADLQGGTITSVTSDTLNCTQASDTRVYCTGSADTTGSVTICGSCQNGRTAQSSTPPQYNCAPGYTTLAALVNVCSYQGGSNGGCPPGTQPDASGLCTGGGNTNGGCPAGTYFDAGTKSCVSRGKPQQDCLDGFAYNVDQGCCQMDSQSDLPSYPGCGPDEYLTPNGCVPLPLSSVAGGDANCLTVDLTTGLCATVGGNGPEQPSCPPGTTLVCDPKTGACTCQPTLR